MKDDAENREGSPAIEVTSNPIPAKSDEHTDNRKHWDWKSKYPPEAKKKMCCEAAYLALFLTLSILITGFLWGLGEKVFEIPISNTQAPTILWINCKLVATFFVGCIGGFVLSIKWFVHSVAKGKWHLDRRYWRFFVPWTGGIYALVVLALLYAGLFPGAANQQNTNSTTSFALAFLVGYFSDGVSGLLSNVANAVFGTLEKK